METSTVEEVVPYSDVQRHCEHSNQDLKQANNDGQKVRLRKAETATQQDFKKFLRKASGLEPNFVKTRKSSLRLHSEHLLKQLCIAVIIIALTIAGFLRRLFCFKLNTQHTKPLIERTYVHDKRILIGGAGGLLWYQQGLMAVLLEHYQDRLSHGVIFEGVSAGAACAFVLAACSKGLGTVSEYICVTCDCSESLNNYPKAYGFVGHDAWNMAHKWFETAMNHASEANFSLESITKDRCVMWVTDAFSLRSVPWCSFPDSHHLADGWLTSAFIPGFMAPSFWNHHLTPYDGYSLDGCVALSAGDYHMFEPKTTSSGRQVKTIYIEAFPGDIPAELVTGPHIRTLRLWEWDDWHSESYYLGCLDPVHLQDLYIRGYHKSKERFEEVDEVMKWLLSEDEDH